MELLFQVKDKTGRLIQLSEERWKHILQEHPDINNIEEIKSVLVQPLKITESKYDPEHVRYYYQYKKDAKKYLFVAGSVLKVLCHLFASTKNIYLRSLYGVGPFGCTEQ